MASEKIGDCTCPLCGGTARLGLAKSLLPVLVCNGCNTQLFARSNRSDLLLRGLLIKPGPEPEPAPAPAEPESPRTAKQPEPTGIANNTNEPAPVRTEKRSPFSIF